MTFDELFAKWSGSGAAERANKDAFLLDLCDALGIEKPAPYNKVPGNPYVFEREVILLREGHSTVGHIDFYKKDCFILEAKQGSEAASKKLGTARRGTPGWNQAMSDAFGQALGYASTQANPPPFLIACDVGHCLDLYACFDGSRRWRPFPTAREYRIFLRDLADKGELQDRLRTIFTDPLSLDPERQAVRVTRAVASHLADVARSLEERYPREVVARFLMRCLFTMFAEDVGLLPDKIFEKELTGRWLQQPNLFPLGVEALWRDMDEGEVTMQGYKLLRFNGGLFSERTGLALTKEELIWLLDAARCDWRDVEPAIFGTLLERALDPRERHALGAHFTPRVYVERLVHPTIEEPLRERWDTARAEARILVERGDEAGARKRIHAYLNELKHVKVLDPACGTGNFLYVTLDLMKRLESEAIELLRQLGEKESLLFGEAFRVTPEGFIGLELNPWAKEIAELVLWIGYLQWHYRTHGKVNPPEPVLRDYKNFQWGDAVLVYDAKEPVLDEKGRPLTRWDGETYKRNPVTGEQVPDESARTPIYRYLNPRRAEWPKADFIVGNPPFMGNKRMRQTLGGGYVEALREAHPDVPDTVDFVMYWWDHAAELVRTGKAQRFGLITTNSVTQIFSRKLVAQHLAAQKPLSLAFAIPDHPWVETADGAAVRIAMTVGVPGKETGMLASVAAERTLDNDDFVEVDLAYRRGTIHADLTVGPAVVNATPLQANEQLSFQGPILVGEGFRLDPGELRSLRLSPLKLPPVVHPYVIGRDIVQAPKERYVIDFFGLVEKEARDLYPELLQRVVDRVKPERDANRDALFRERWWLFGRPRPAMRTALAGLSRYIATVETSKFKPFVFLPAEVCPDHKLYVIASDDAFHLGVLSSSAHRLWAEAAGGHLGVGNDPTWTNTTCFLPFAFPTCDDTSTARIREVGEALDAHRKRQQALHPELTLTGMYNVLEKLRSGAELTEKERATHEKGLVSLLRKIHDDLDTAVLEAYGWPRDLTDEQIVERLVALNAERAAEEERGQVRWLRPEFQRGEAKPAKPKQVAMPGVEPVAPAAAVDEAQWPRTFTERIVSVRSVLSSKRAWSAREMATRFKPSGKRAPNKGEVEEILEGLRALGLALRFEERGETKWAATARAE